MWASSEYGVLSFDVDSFRVRNMIQYEDGLPQNGIAGIISDPNSPSLWAASAKGMVLIDSEKGKGACFWFEIPWHFERLTPLKKAEPGDASLIIYETNTTF